MKLELELGESTRDDRSLWLDTYGYGDETDTFLRIIYWRNYTDNLYVVPEIWRNAYAYDWI